MDAVTALLDSDTDTQSGSGGSGVASKCHPLCSCDLCEKRIHEEEENPRTRVTVFSRDDRGYTGVCSVGKVVLCFNHIAF